MWRGKVRGRKRREKEAVGENMRSRKSDQEREKVGEEGEKVRSRGMERKEEGRTPELAGHTSTGKEGGVRQWVRRLSI